MPNKSTNSKTIRAAIRRIYSTGYGFWPFLMHRLDQPPDYFFVFKFGVLTRALVG